MHFAAASLFLVLGGIALAARASALAAGAFPDPGLIAATHLLTLGWITTSIWGALYRLLPAALGASIRWPRLTRVTLWLWVIGVTGFVLGHALRRPALHIPAAAVLGIAILLFAVNLGATLPRAARGRFTAVCLAGATLFLIGAWVLGLLLSINLGVGMLRASRFTVLTVHLHLAAGGWALLAIIGLSDRLLPILLPVHRSSGVPGRIAAALVGAGALMLLLSGHLLPVGTLGAALWLMAAGALAFVAQGALYLRRCGRGLGPGMRLVAVSLALLGLAAVIGVAALLSEAPPARLLVAYGVLLVPGGLALFLAGHYYEIGPAFHRVEAAIADREAPPAGRRFDPRVAHAAAALLAGGVMVLAAGTLAGASAVCLAGGLAFTLGATLQAVQFLRSGEPRPDRSR